MKTKESREFDIACEKYEKHFSKRYVVSFGDRRTIKEHIAAIIRAIETNTLIEPVDYSNLPPGVRV